MKRDYKLFIKDILTAINKIEDFISYNSFDEFMRDEKTKSAVVREIEVIGEATYLNHKEHRYFLPSAFSFFYSHVEKICCFN